MWPPAVTERPLKCRGQHQELGVKHGEIFLSSEKGEGNFQNRSKKLLISLRGERLDLICHFIILISNLNCSLRLQLNHCLCPACPSPSHLFSSSWGKTILKRILSISPFVQEDKESPAVLRLGLGSQTDSKVSRLPFISLWSIQLPLTLPLLNRASSTS